MEKLVKYVGLIVLTFFVIVGYVISPKEDEEYDE
jgi:TM2 domain-containing membrane protein YozV